MPGFPVPAPTWRTVDVAGQPIELLEAGRGDPLLFLHGWGLTPRAYADAVLRLCAAGVRVIAPTLPGFGGSAPLSLRAGVGQYAERMAALLDALEPQRPVFLAGHSFGGGIALKLAAQRPELIRSVTLVNPVGGSDGPLLRANLLWWAAGAVTELDPREWLLRRGAGRAAARLLRDLVPNVVRRPLHAASTAVAALSANLADEARSLLEMGVPVLFVWGDQDKVVLPGRLSALGGPLSSEVVAGRHGWIINHPEEFADILRDALVVHALLERRQRGIPAPPATRFPDLRELFPEERRRRARHRPLDDQRRPSAGPALGAG